MTRLYSVISNHHNTIVSISITAAIGLGFGLFIALPILAQSDDPFFILRQAQGMEGVINE